MVQGASDTYPSLGMPEYNMCAPCVAGEGHERREREAGTCMYRRARFSTSLPNASFPIPLFCTSVSLCYCDAAVRIVRQSKVLTLRNSTSIFCGISSLAPRSHVGPVQGFEWVHTSPKSWSVPSVSHIEKVYMREPALVRTRAKSRPGASPAVDCQWGMSPAQVTVH